MLDTVNDLALLPGEAVVRRAGYFLEYVEMALDFGQLLIGLDFPALRALHGVSRAAHGAVAFLREEKRVVNHAAEKQRDQQAV